MARTNKRVKGDKEKRRQVGVGLLWVAFEIIAYFFLEVLLAITNLLYLTSQSAVAMK